MKLEYLKDINEHNDNLIRLFDFDTTEAGEFHKRLSENIIQKNVNLDLSTIEFIEPINCNLTLRISEIDNGISSSDNYNYYCDLTVEKYEEMLLIIEPFSRSAKVGRCNWLYDLNIPTEFLFSSDGNW